MPREAKQKNTMGGATPRRENDCYLTPDALALAICRRLAETVTPDLVVEPSVGAGAFVRAARAVWGSPYISAVEPGTIDAGSLDGADVVWRGRWESIDAVAQAQFGPRPMMVAPLILGNPPYNLPGDGRGDHPTTAERHVLLALDRLPEGGHVAFLLRLAFLGGGRRIERLHARHPLAALWPVTPRPSFTGGGTDASEYAVFVWRKGYAGPVDLRPLRWEASDAA